MWVMHTPCIRVCIKYAKGAKVEVTSIIDVMLVKKDMLCYVPDVRGMRQGFSDHHVVL